MKLSPCWENQVSGLEQLLFTKLQRSLIHGLNTFISVGNDYINLRQKFLNNFGLKSNFT